jgi:hypothetical protein
VSHDVHLYDLLLDLYPLLDDRLDPIYDIETMALYEKGLDFFKAPSSGVHTRLEVHQQYLELPLLQHPNLSDLQYPLQISSDDRAAIGHHARALSRVHRLGIRRAGLVPAMGLRKTGYILYHRNDADHTAVLDQQDDRYQFIF